MGTKQHIPETKLWDIPLIDNQSGTLPISSLKEAIELLKELTADY